MIRKLFFLFVFFLFAFSADARTAARADCFPFERLAPEKRERAEQLLLKALDSEALYTIVGNLKPMSSGFLSFDFPARLPRLSEQEALDAEKTLGAKAAETLSAEEKARLAQAKQAVSRARTLREIEEIREILALWRCGAGDGAFFADVQHFAKTFEGRRHAEAVVFNRANLRRAVREKSDFFSRWAITANSHPLQILYAVETDETGARFGGYGYLFGYPDYAVEFFVRAADSEEFTGKFVERDFYSVPTFSRPTNGFVWAVPKNHAENEIDKAIRAEAAKIYAEYKTRRERYIGAGKKGVVEMMRDWFCGEKAICAVG
jgi:hypothetical protein